MVKIKKKWVKGVLRIKNESKSRHGYLRLDKNEKIEKLTKKKWKNFLNSLSQDDFSSYPEVEKIYRRLSDKIKIKRNNIYLTSGSDASIRFFFEIFTSVKSNVLTSNPCFPMYKVYAKINKNNLVYVNYKSDLKIDINEFEKKINSDIDAIIFANPNSPVGDLIDEKTLKKLLNKAKRFKIPFFLDQAYYEFSDTDMKNLTKKFDNLIISRTFSKGMGAAGVRLAYVISSRKIINLFEKTRPLYEINQIAVKYGLFLLDNYPLMLKYCSKTILSRDKLCSMFNKKKFKTINSKTNSIHISFGERTKKVTKILKKYKVLFKFSNIPTSSKRNWVRLTVFPNIEKEKFTKEILQCQK